MKRKIVEIMLLTFVCISCDQGDGSKQNYIDFGTNAIRTKGVLVNEFPEQGEFGVLGYCYVDGSGSGDWQTKCSRSVPDVFYNQRVKYTQAAGCVYSPLKSWSQDNNDKYTFFAYYPWQDQANVNRQISLSPSTQTNAPMLTYTMPYTSSSLTTLLSSSGMVDVMVASDIDRTNSMGMSQLEFKHLLTAFDFAVNNYKDGENVILRSVTMRGTFARRMTANMETMDYTIDPTTTFKGTFTIHSLNDTPRIIEPNITGGMETINAPNNVLLLIPQTITPADYASGLWRVTVRYGNTSIITKTFYIGGTSDMVFQPGIKNTLCLDFLGDACTIRVLSGNSWDTPPGQDSNPTFE